MACASSDALRSAPLLARLRAWRGSRQHTLIVLATLAAFALQSFIVQTHIHFAAYPALETIAATQLVQRSSTGEDPALCAICQEFLHAGQYLTPAPVVALPISLVAIAFAMLHAFVLARSPVSHSWHGRAPPSA
jgi:hypothetical protein